MPKLQGKYVFAPAVGPDGSRVRRDGTTTDWWLIIQCDRDAGKYLRRLYELAHPSAASLSEPLWGTHVSVIRGEVPTNPCPWGDRDGAPITIEYAQQPQQASGYVFLPVQCDAALEYRQQLGLPRQPQWPLHLTIGNYKD